MNTIEFCAGTCGQSIWLGQAAFGHSDLVEIEQDYAAPLRLNRLNCNVRCADDFDGRSFEDINMFEQAGVAAK